MTVYVVTWNLNRERSNYAAAREAFVRQFDKYDTIADSGLESVRFVATTQSADLLSADLRRKMDDNDRLLVSQMNTGEHQGWLSKKTWDWINARL
ncbi:hypothetical protein ACGYKD_18130 [Sulfitobacter sp. TB366]|uniref:hypothetical protein n=1 Tax=unclassified Sulfitobacter TaxID=196795 RepID=UPI003744FB21